MSYAVEVLLQEYDRLSRIAAKNRATLSLPDKPFGYKGPKDYRPYDRGLCRALERVAERYEGYCAELLAAIERLS